MRALFRHLQIYGSASLFDINRDVRRIKVSFTGAVQTTVIPEGQNGNWQGSYRKKMVNSRYVPSVEVVGM